MVQGNRPLTIASRIRLKRHIRFRADIAADIAARHGATNDQERAAFFGVSPSAYSRVLHGMRRPGEEFIAAVLGVNDPDAVFDQLFEVVGP